MTSDPSNHPVGSYSLDKSKIKFLLLEGIHERAVEVLSGQGYEQVETLRRALSGGELREALQGVHFVGIRSRTQLDAAAVAAADRLAAVGCFCIGTNQVDLRAAAVAGIPVFNAPFSNTRSVTLASLMKHSVSDSPCASQVPSINSSSGSCAETVAASPKTATAATTGWHRDCGSMFSLSRPKGRP